MAKCIYLSRPVRVVDTLVSETGEEIYLVVAMAKAANQYRLTKSLREVSDDVWNAKVENFNSPAYPLDDKEPCKLPEFFKVGAIIKSFGCNGVVTEVYTSASTGNQAATVWFIKNIFKKQEPETELAEVFEESEESTIADALLEHVKSLSDIENAQKQWTDMVISLSNETRDMSIPVSRSDALRIARETLENAERERVADAELDATRGVQYDDGRSVIIGNGYGSSHVWEKPDLFQMKLHIDGKTILPVGGPTVYRCKKCWVIFRHYYHETPDIFEAIKKAFVPDECAGAG